MLSEDDVNTFKKLYDLYCLQPAIKARSYIYEQCVLVDKEYKFNKIPEFRIK